MQHQLLLFLTLASVTYIYAQIDYAACGLPQNAGKTCKTAKPSIRYQYDNKTKLCFAFKYHGCGGNKNKFKTIGDCQKCNERGARRCPANTPKGDVCSKDADCKATEYCNQGWNGSGECCRKNALKNFDLDSEPRCGAGKTKVMIDDSNLLMGRNCKAKFCPAGAVCKAGTFFSTCCKKV